MTLAIAIVGLVVGLASGLAQVLAFLRDRAKLSITFDGTMESGYTPDLCVLVANKGRQPTTVVSAALVVGGDMEIRGEGEETPFYTGPIELGVDEGEVPAVVMPGEVSRFCVSLSKWPGLVHADDPLRPYVVDIRNRRTWGPALPFLRVFLKWGWEPPGVSDPRLLEPAPGGPRPTSPVEPRWKLWKPAELRKAHLPFWEE